MVIRIAHTDYFFKSLTIIRASIYFTVSIKFDFAYIESKFPKNREY